MIHTEGNFAILFKWNPKESTIDQVDSILDEYFKSDYSSWLNYEVTPLCVITSTGEVIPVVKKDMFGIGRNTDSSREQQEQAYNNLDKELRWDNARDEVRSLIIGKLNSNIRTVIWGYQNDIIIREIKSNVSPLQIRKLLAKTIKYYIDKVPSTYLYFMERLVNYLGQFHSSSLDLFTTSIEDPDDTIGGVDMRDVYPENYIPAIIFFDVND